LASLYDQKGGMENYSDEQKTFSLYQEYFETLGALNVPYGLDYVVRYSAFIKAEYNIHTYKSNKKHYKNLLKIHIKT
jgi:hypothetical protein